MRRKATGQGRCFPGWGAPPLGAFIRAGHTALGSAEDDGKPALMTGYHARGVISPDFCVFWYVLLRDGAAGVLVCGLCRDVMGRYFHFVAWMAAVVLTFAGSCCQLPSSVADGGYIQSNNNMNRNPESESGIRIPNQNQNLKEERFSLFSIQSNPMQCNPTAAARMIFGAAAWTREREFTNFSEKSGQGKRRQIVGAVFLFGGQRERGREKLPLALGMQGKGSRLLPWGGRGRKEHRERHKKREKQGKNDAMLLTGDGRRRFCRDLWKSRTEPFIAASESERQCRAFQSEYGDVLRTACG